MKGLIAWAALGGLFSACALEVEEPGEGLPGPIPGPPRSPPPGGFGGYGGGGTGRQSATEGGAGGAESPAPPAPPRAELVRPRATSPGCFSNEDCGAGLCVNGRCQAFCGGDAECEGGDACVLGLCRADAGRGWECIEQADCAEIEDCVGGDCLRRCLRDGHCDADAEVACSFGYCGLIR